MRLIPTSSGKLYAGSVYDATTLIKSKPRKIFDLIWNLAEEFEFLLKQEALYAHNVIWGQIKDYSVPDRTVFNKQLITVVDCLKHGGKVFCHCKGGIGRTSTAVAIIKKQLDGMSALEALQITRSYCHGPETIEQINFVKHYK